MKLRSTLTRITVVALMSTFVPAATLAPVFMPASAVAATPTANTATALVQGTGKNASFVGSFTVTSFKVVNGVLSAVGTLTGSLTTPSGVQQVNQQVTMAVSSLQASCTILTLDLGPLDLTLLGLNIHLNEIVLTITANPAGGILGQLLCSLANLLNGGLSGLLQQIADLLNQILAAL